MFFSELPVWWDMWSFPGGYITQRIQKWYIYLHSYSYIWLIFMVKVGEYTSPMDPLGKATPSLNDD